MKRTLLTVALICFSAVGYAGTYIDGVPDIPSGGGSVTNIGTWASYPATANVVPNGSNTISLGTPAFPFRDVYMGTNSIYMNNVRVMWYDPVSSQLVSGVQLVQQSSGSSNIVIYVTNTVASEITSADTNLWTKSSVDYSAVTNWLAQNTGSIAYVYSRTGLWDRAVIDSSVATNWLTQNTGAFAYVLTRTGTWNQASSDAIAATSGVVALNARTQTWDTVTQKVSTNDAKYLAVVTNGQSGINFGSLTVESHTVLTNEALWLASVAYRITAGDTNNWSTAFSWGNHALMNYLTNNQQSVALGLSGSTEAIKASNTTQVVNYQTMTNWVASWGYLTNEALWLASVAYRITAGDTQLWHKAAADGVSATGGVASLNATVLKKDGSVTWTGYQNMGGAGASNGTMGAGVTWNGNQIAGEYVAYTRTNITHSHVFTAVTVTNCSVELPYPGASISWGKMYATATNTTSRTATLTFYANNDYKGSNAYWRAAMPIVVVPLTNSAATGDTRLQTSDGSGFTVNDLVYTCDSNEFARISAITNNDLYLEDALVFPHGTTSSVSKVSEFGGFTTIDWSATSNAWHKISFTNVVTQTIKMDYSIRR